ncbi:MULTISPECIES: hypothetical protein [unclassified Rhizobium]|uniref:hypothetical protein n=1 Tax=unclassified Rhizobium TaxID=2613769 RepID=UPI0007EAFAA0|nr:MULTISPECIES: hypothetical protein [unclassified Rhizobium]ANL12033.1 hypothetical protein AMJ98_PA00087 [Rhizobium sp. N1341]ANM42878.1 hypothetical protein AMK03_PA00087 [Rhizobium sp. N741]
MGNVINFADRKAALMEGTPSRKTINVATEIETMLNNLRSSMKDVLLLARELQGFTMVHGGDMQAETHRLLMLANNRLMQATGHLQGTASELDSAGFNEAGMYFDSFVELELPVDTSDWYSDIPAPEPA